MHVADADAGEAGVLGGQLGGESVAAGGGREVGHHEGGMEGEQGVRYVGPQLGDKVGDLGHLLRSELAPRSIFLRLSDRSCQRPFVEFILSEAEWT